MRTRPLAGHPGPECMPSSAVNMRSLIALIYPLPRKHQLDSEIRIGYAQRVVPPEHCRESRPDLEPYGFTCEVWEPQPMNRADRHNELQLNLLESGSLTYLLAGRRVTLRPRRLLGDHAPPDPGIRRAVLLELKARLLRLAASARQPTRDQAAPRGVLTAGGEAPTSERMATFIARHYMDAIGLAEVAREVELHPDYAASLFRKGFGVTPTRFILQHRVSHAQRMLVTSEAKVLEVAMESGFGSLSRFNAAFRQLCGCSPREYRAIHRL
jgi:AraC family transcriptional regulator, melibiose operon regulatory protein